MLLSRDGLSRALSTPHGAWVTLVAAFAVRLVIALLLPQEIVWYDGEPYYTIAQSLLNGEGLGSLYMNRLSVPSQPLLIAAM